MNIMKFNTAILLLTIFIAVFLSGCATPLTSKAAFVRVTIHSEDVKNCTWLGQITSSSNWGGYAATGVGFESAMNELKNKAAKLGADVILTQAVSNTTGGTNMIADAYNCKNKNDQ